METATVCDRCGGRRMRRCPDMCFKYWSCFIGTHTEYFMEDW